jgi:hypothetical protein
VRLLDAARRELRKLDIDWHDDDPWDPLGANELRRLPLDRRGAASESEHEDRDDRVSEAAGRGATRWVGHAILFWTDAGIAGARIAGVSVQLLDS